MKPITRAKTCQNCKFGHFKKRDWIGASGKSINGLCMKYADAEMPRRFAPETYVMHSSITYRAFKEARELLDLPGYDTFKADALACPWHRYTTITEESIRIWYAGCIAWASWWIRNWQTVAERKIDRTTVCDEWDGTQTSKFYRPPKVKRARQS